MWALKPEGLKRHLDFEAHKNAAVGSICFESSRGCMLTFAPSAPSIKSWTPESGSMTGEISCYPPDFAPDPTNRIPDDLKVSMPKEFSVNPAKEPHGTEK